MMKLTLRIVNTDDLLPDQASSCTWEGEGGSIGRIAGNDWVLPDDRSEISRVHARVYFKNDLYYIEDLSTNGVFVGDVDQRIDRVPYALNHGDHLFIGHYQIEVGLSETSAALDISSIQALPPFEPEQLAQAPQPPKLIPDDWMNASIDKALSGDDTGSNVQPPVLSKSELVGPSSSGDSHKNNHSLAKHWVAQKLAFEKTLDAVLSLFDQDYVACLLKQEDKSRSELTQYYYDTVFTKTYKAKLQQLAANKSASPKSSSQS